MFKSKCVYTETLGFGNYYTYYSNLIDNKITNADSPTPLFVTSITFNAGVALA